MKTRTYTSAAIRILVAVVAFTAFAAWAENPASQGIQGSIRSLFAASGHSVMAVGNVVGATLAVSAVPLAIGGSVLTTLGQASAAASDALGTPGAALPISDEVITVTPPARALQQAPAAVPSMP